ncbi:MAG: choice-of-anchor J domain-containing protein [Phycisphaeraceae bacterium]|nr:choice-of-anchor J domain-containing protein [Phycisphaeraceae bacterium]
MKVAAAALMIAAAAAGANAQSFTEGFDGSSLLPSLWTSVNNSANGPGVNPDWAQTPGNVGNWLPYEGDGYVAVGYNAIVGAGDISVYLISPVVTFNNGDTISFWTRTWENVYFPDRLALVYNTDGSTDPSSFTNTLLTINPNLTTTEYPTTWTQFTATISGLPESANGRFAFWYNPSDGGPWGSNSDRVGIDSVVYSSVPAPGSLALLTAGMLVCGRRKR